MFLMFLSPPYGVTDPPPPPKKGQFNYWQVIVNTEWEAEGAGGGGESDIDKVTTE